MKKTELNHDNNQTTDRVFELGLYDKKGYINTKRLAKHYVFFTLIFFLISFNSLIYFNLKYNFDYSRGLDFTYFLNIKEWFYDNLFNNITLSTDFIFIMFISLIIPLIYIVIHYKNLNFKTKIQSKMASLNLNQYYLKKYKNGVYNWKLIKGQSRNFEAFKNKAKDIQQLFETENIKIKRNGENGSVIMETIPNFPSIDRLKKLNVNYKDYLLDDFLFLGFTNDSEEIRGIKKISMGKKFMNYYRIYLPLKDLLIHISLIGRAGFGKSNNFASFLNSFLMNMDTIDTLIIHDFKGIESSSMEKNLLEKNESFKNRIFTSSTMNELYNVLIKLSIIYEYRKQIMMKNNQKNYTGGKIILMLDEYNAGFTDITSNDKEKRKLATETSELLDNVARLYRAMGIYLLISGQSSLVTDNFSSRLRKQCNIQFNLKNTGTMRTSLGIAYEEGGEDISTYSKGQTLFINNNNSTFFKFMPRYIPEDFLKDFVNYTPKEKQEIDKQMPLYLDNLEDKIIAEKEEEIEQKNRLKEDKDQEDKEKTLRIFKLILKENIEDLKNGIFKRSKKEKSIFENTPKKEINEIKSIEKNEIKTIEKKNNNLNNVNNILDLTPEELEKYEKILKD